MEITHIDVNGRKRPIGMDDPAPVFHYQVSREKDGEQISAVRMVLKNGRKIIWDTGKEPYPGEMARNYAGPKLQPKTIYDLMVTVWNEEDEEFEADRGICFETGFLNGDQKAWKTSWIGADPECRDTCVMFRRDFELEKDVKQARIYATARGVYQITCNHQALSLNHLTPQPSENPSEKYYQTYPVTGMIQKGSNVLEVMLAPGWGEEKDNLALLLQLEILYTDKTSEIIGTDEQFLWRKSWITGSDIEGGENWDLAAKEQMEKLEGDRLMGRIPDPELEETYAWKPCRTAENQELHAAPGELLLGDPGDGLRITEETEVLGVLETPVGELVLDFGKTVTGSCQIRLRGQKGQKAVFSYRECLKEDGTFGNGIGADRQEKGDSLICTEGYQVFDPQFTLHTFRYVKVEGVEYGQLCGASAFSIGKNQE